MNSLDMKEIGEIIKFYRRQRGLTQLQLSVMIDVDEKQLGKIERGVHYPSLPTFLKLIKILEIDINEFYKCKLDVLPETNKLMHFVRSLSPKQSELAYKIMNVIYNC